MKLLSMFTSDSRIAQLPGKRLRTVYGRWARLRLATSTLAVMAVITIAPPAIIPAAIAPTTVCAQESDAAAEQDESLFQAAVRQTDPLTPAQQQASFSLPEGFEISCFASEPDLQKPMNMAFDDDGRLWVTGSNEYPIPAKPGMGTDSVRILEDTDSDGVADSVTVFADNLNIPIGLLPYKGGAIVFTIPDIVHLEDTNGDGKADRQTKLFGPFDTSRDTHGMTNSFTTYHDGWVYACHGFNNQTTVVGTDGHSVTMHSGNTYRFRPDGSRIEIWSRGQVNPFGMTCDDVGDLFTSDCHSKPVNLLMRGGYHESFGRPNDGLGFIPNVMEHQHGSTAIDAACWIDCPKFPKTMQGSLLLGNVMTGRVHRNRIVRQGATIKMHQEDDFVVSSDPWFRPVDIQAGPDSAIYVADFYNRIIGHYEVPLNHEGRDRHRGRIWKIRYVGNDSAEQQQLENVRLADASLDELLKKLIDPALQMRMRAAELLVNHHDAAADERIREAWQLAVNRQTIAASHLLWVLHRTNKLQPADLQAALDSRDRVLKIHAMKVCSERPDSDFLTEQIKRGMRDPDRLVERAAADAAAMHPSVIAFKELVNVLTVSPTDDVHLRHQAKIALRNQLQSDDVVDWFLQATQPEAAYQACRQVIRGLHTKRAVPIVLAILKNTQQAPEEVAALIGHAAEFADSQSLNQLVHYASQIEDADSDQLVRIRQVLAESLAGNPDADQTAFQAFEASLLDQLVVDVHVNDLHWGRYQWDDRAAGAWGIEQRERSDLPATRFLSSLPGGESAVSVLRSKSFVVPFHLKFEICGHSGSPDQPPSLDNQLILRETKSGAILQSKQPPRNDKADSVNWKLVSSVGRRAVLELHDGLDQKAYAWLALGPMTPAVASPASGQQSEQQKQLLTIVRILKSRSQNGILQDDHLQLLADAVVADQVDGQTRQEAAAILFQQRGLPQMSGLSVLLKYGRVSLPVQNYVANACAVSEPWMGVVYKTDPAAAPVTDELIFQKIPKLQSGDNQIEEAKKSATKIPLMDRSDWIRETVQGVFGELPEFYRTRLAQEMASTPSGAALLVEAMKTGNPSALLLHDASLVSLLKAQGTQIVADVQLMMKDLPKEESVPPDYVATVLSRLKNDTHPTDLESGKVLFERHCIVCHRRNSKGGQAGPQLDGVKTRGSERLLEDILYPHRNVDIAFRTSVVILKSGKTISGLSRPQQNGRTVAIVKADGTVQEVAIQDIEQQTDTLRSLMPPGFHKLMSETEMVNLLSSLNQ